MNIKERIGARIKELRLQLELTQEALAFKAEVDKTYFNEVENAKRNIAVINLEKIILALDVSVQDFFDSELFTSKKRGKK